MDPPDNIGLSYADDPNGDCWELDRDYIHWLQLLAKSATELCPKVWISINARWLPYVDFTYPISGGHRVFVWTYTFGNYNGSQVTNCFRPIFRLGKTHGERCWHPEAVRVTSQRAKLGDKRRAGPDKNPDDVLNFPRVVGNSPERRHWHPTQHPEALYEWILRYSLGCNPSGTVLDCFAGSGTCFRSWGRYDVQTIGIDISPTYCDELKVEHELELRYV